MRMGANVTGGEMCHNRASEGSCDDSPVSHSESMLGESPTGVGLVIR